MSSSSSKKPGDWDCPECDHLNFSRRDSCQRCGEQRPLGGGGSGGGGGGSGGGDYTRYYGSYGGGTGGGTGASRGNYGNYGDDVRPGDWYCPECNAHNFASRTGCFKCGSYRDEPPQDGRRYEPSRRDRERSSVAAGGYNVAAPGSRSGWKSGDWICSRAGCKEHNFASRLECFRCSAPRDSEWCLVKPYGSDL